MCVLQEHHMMGHNTSINSERKCKTKFYLCDLENQGHVPNMNELASSDAYGEAIIKFQFDSHNDKTFQIIMQKRVSLGRMD